MSMNEEAAMTRAEQLLRGAIHEIRELEHSRTEAEAEAATHARENVTLRNQVTEARAQRDGLREERDDKAEEAHQLRRENVTLREEVERLEERIKSWAMSDQRQQMEITDLRAKLATAESDQRLLDRVLLKELEGLREENRKLRAQVQAEQEETDKQRRISCDLEKRLADRTLLWDPGTTLVYPLGHTEVHVFREDRSSLVVHAPNGAPLIVCPDAANRLRVRVV